MAETNAYPTEAEVLLIRSDLKDFLSTGRTLYQEMQESLKECKRVLEDERNVKWAQVFNSTTDAYLDNSDATGRNEDRIKNAISNMTAAIIFRGYSVIDSEEESWSSLADYYEGKAMKRLVDSILDIDLDEDGGIDSDEEGVTGQVFMVK